MNDRERLDRRLSIDLNACARVMEQRLGFPANGLATVVADYHGVETAKLSLRRPIRAHMLGRMWERDLLRFTVEAMVVLPWYAGLFTQEERSEAEDRLEKMGFDVKRYLRAADRCGKNEFTRRLLVDAGSIRRGDPLPSL